MGDQRVLQVRTIRPFTTFAAASVLARLALAAVSLAAAFYLLPASVSIVAWPSDGPSRIALLPPLSRLWLGMGGSLVLVAAVAVWWRARGGDPLRFATASERICLSLLWIVPYLPWLPDRAPVLLVFAGPLRWVVLAVAVVAAAVALFSGTEVGVGLLPPSQARTVVFALSLVLYGALGLRFTAAAGFSGDEPHYLVIAHSLLVDHDLDISNNHEHRDYRAFFAGELRPDYLQRGQHGEIYSIHAPGLPALLLPAYALGGARGAVIAMAALAALAALAIFELATVVASGAGAFATWAAVCLTVPFVPHAWLVYPEIVGALIVGWSVLWIVRPAEQTPRLLSSFARGALVAALPWMHTKFIVLMGLVAAWQCIRIGVRHRGEFATVSDTIPEHDLRAAATFLGPIVVSTGAWLLFFYGHYGTLSPEAPYGSSTQLDVLARNIPHGTLGLLFDQKFGLLAYSPVYLLAIAGIVLMLRDRELRNIALGLVIVAVGFLLSTTRFYMWWGGSSAPARFLVPLLPLLAPAIAVAADRLRTISGRVAVLATLSASVGIAAVCVVSARGDLLFSDPHGTSRLLQAVQGSAPLDVSLPTFTEEHWTRALGLLVLWLAAGAASIAAMTAAVRNRIVRSSFAAAMTAALMFVALAAALVRAANPVDRDAVADRGRLTTIHAYDAARLRAADPDRFRPLSAADLSQALTIERTGLPERPTLLPEGEYQAQVSFADNVPLTGEARVTIGDRLIIASAPLVNPTLARFTLAVQSPVRIGITSEAAARAVTLVRLTPVALAAGAARSAADVTAIEPVEGRPGSYMAYVGENAYPEGGVFWTRGTETSRLYLLPAGAARLRLILHVGPTGAHVAIRVAGSQIDVDMTENETREVTIALPGTARVALEVHASRAFRPAEVDESSDDQRSLGVQVHPRFE